MQVEKKLKKFLGMLDEVEKLVRPHVASRLHSILFEACFTVQINLHILLSSRR